MTLRVQRCGPPFEGPGVIAFWHGDQLPLLAIRPGDAVAPMSLSRDGRLQARVMAAFGVRDVAGSSSRGALAAARGLRRQVAGGAVALVAVDGPRGPARVAKPGAAWLARHVGCPLWPVAVDAVGWRLRAWDRFLLPRPFSRVVVAVGEPVSLAAGLSADELAAHTGAALEAASAVARAHREQGAENRVDAH
ncbi:MAG: DUF374 domain-containing protein [Myxococcales bacterium]|nr:DUF374 domain-containing protein [Myxococcales bacterium]